jgi:MATE family multidrug resistance protein
LIRRLKKRWNAEGGYRDLLRLAFPLILSTGSWTIQQVVDRIFLAWFSPAATAAALPAGMMHFTLMSLATGTAAYVGTFVAQYTGAGQTRRIGPIVWQGMYFSLAAGAFMMVFFPLAPSGFRLAGHPVEVRAMELTYFRTLLFGTFPAVASTALSGFFSGRGKTWTVMWVTASATAVNVVFDAVLIFGKAGFPRLGIFGAALATVFSQVVSLFAYLALMWRHDYQERFHTLSGWRFNQSLFTRLIRYGFPAGLHFFLDMIGFTLFLMVVGQYGMVPLAATNVAFNINNFSFMPMIGFGMAASIFVGQKLGEHRPELAEYGTWSAAHLTFFYMTVVAALYVLFPGLFLAPYLAKADPVEFRPIAAMAKHLLRFVAVYSLFDTMNIVFASAVKGAGDTRFVMWVSVALSWFVLVLPAYAGVRTGLIGLDGLWTIVTVYVCVTGLVFFARFVKGKWKTMRVIEAA